MAHIPFSLSLKLGALRSLGAISSLTVATGVGLGVALGMVSPVTPVLAQPARPAKLTPTKKPPLLIPNSQRPNATRAGGSLGESCREGNKTILALVPVTNPVTTTRSHPALWVYVPYGANEVQGAEFVVNAGVEEKQRLYRTTIALPPQQGFVRLTLPPQSQYALQPGLPYRWYFTVHCDQVALSVDAGIERVAGDAATVVETAWYDQFETVAQQFQANPQDAQKRDRWQQLLRSLGLEALAAEPIAFR